MTGLKQTAINVTQHKLLTTIINSANFYQELWWEVIFIVATTPKK